MSYQPGGIAAPDYGRPPKKSRPGLFIALMLVLLVAVLGTGVWVASKVVADIKPSPSTPPPAPITSVAPRPTTAKPKPPKPVKTVPVKPVPITPVPPASGTPVQVATQFVGRLNANDVKGATALACADTKVTIPPLIKQYVRPPTSLTMNKTPVGNAGPIVVFALNGTTRGATVGGTLVMEVGSGRPCVKAFLLPAFG
ncbi:hypothetical protein E1263_04160 [Kribbella antibiotica]|uniref:Uncharacterized protein n=1 Tax=Kribbella antibiotica TaxID=190195 RepID=A0A4R4ZVF0_9ACTN|nr:hypothetical protein [Kribbella antibiotica]TDD62356.1 hypothetical protein E1263_04160 [Kribbella antibiotica]